MQLICPNLRATKTCLNIYKEVVPPKGEVDRVHTTVPVQFSRTPTHQTHTCVSVWASTDLRMRVCGSRRKSCADQLPPSGEGKSSASAVC